MYNYKPQSDNVDLSQAFSAPGGRPSFIKFSDDPEPAKPESSKKDVPPTFGDALFSNKPAPQVRLFTHYDLAELSDQIAFNLDGVQLKDLDYITYESRGDQVYPVLVNYDGSRLRLVDCDSSIYCIRKFPNGYLNDDCIDHDAKFYVPKSRIIAEWSYESNRKIWSIYKHNGFDPYKFTAFERAEFQKKYVNGKLDANIPLMGKPTLRSKYISRFQPKDVMPILAYDIIELARGILSDEHTHFKITIHECNYALYLGTSGNDLAELLHVPFVKDVSVCYHLIGYELGTIQTIEWAIDNSEEYNAIEITAQLPSGKDLYNALDNLAYELVTVPEPPKDRLQKIFEQTYNDELWKHNPEAAVKVLISKISPEDFAKLKEMSAGNSDE